MSEHRDTTWEKDQSHRIIPSNMKRLQLNVGSGLKDKFCFFMIEQLVQLDLHIKIC